VNGGWAAAAVPPKEPCKETTVLTYAQTKPHDTREYAAYIFSDDTKAWFMSFFTPSSQEMDRAYSTDPRAHKGLTFSRHNNLVTFLC